METKQCQADLIGERFGRHCSRKAVVTRDGKSYCKMHDPEYLRARRAEKQVEWDKQWEVEGARVSLGRAQQRAVAGLTLFELEQVTPDLIRERILRPGL